jgi:oxygen-dependent protoporphyrinogen oxidase
LGSLWTSSVFDERTPDGYHLFTTFIGGSRRPELCDNDEDHLIEIAIEELRSIVGIDGAPVLNAVKTWRKAIPQYNIDYESIPPAIISMTKNNPGLYLCSNYYKGISVTDCIRNANSAAGEVIDLFKELEPYQ